MLMRCECLDDILFLTLALGRSLTSEKRMEEAVRDATELDIPNYGPKSQHRVPKVLSPLTNTLLVPVCAWSAYQ